MQAHFLRPRLLAFLHKDASLMRPNHSLEPLRLRGFAAEPALS